MNFVTADDIHAKSSPIKEVSWLNGSNRLPNPDEVEVVEISEERDVSILFLKLNLLLINCVLSDAAGEDRD